MTETSTLPNSDAPQVLPYDPFDPAFHSNPYPTYDRLRAELGTVIPTPAGVAVLGYAEVSGVLNDPRLGRGDGAGVQDTLIPTPAGMQPAVMFMDPPDHTRIRKLVTKAFTPRAVTRLRAPAVDLATRLFAAAREQAAGGPVDLPDQVFRPLAAGVLNTLVGVPESYLPQCIEYANDAGRGLDPAYTLSPEVLDARVKARDGYVAIAQELIETRRAKPEDDLMSELVAVEADGDRLNEIELLTTVANIFLAGFSAPQATLGLAALSLLHNPDQLAWYRDHPERAANAVDELIRYDTTVQLINRTVLEPVTVGGVDLETGQEVFMLLGAANRDPQEYPEPARLDLARPPRQHLGFGHGMHFCVAAPIARLVTEVAMTVLAGLDVQLVTDTPRTNGALAIRSLAELPVTFGRR